MRVSSVLPFKMRGGLEFSPPPLAPEAEKKRESALGRDADGRDRRLEAPPLVKAGRGGLEARLSVEVFKLEYHAELVVERVYYVVLIAQAVVVHLELGFDAGRRRIGRPVEGYRPRQVVAPLPLEGHVAVSYLVAAELDGYPSLDEVLVADPEVVDKVYVSADSAAFCNPYGVVEVSKPVPGLHVDDGRCRRA